jgi:hypothetical protein
LPSATTSGPLHEPDVRCAASCPLAALSDVLIPSASQAGVAEQWLDAVLTALPEVAEPLAALLLTLAGQDPAVAAARLQNEDPASFDLLCTVVAGAYFLNPDVRRSIGYPGQQPVPIQVESPPDYEQDGLLASVLSRGPIYRPTPQK